MASLLALVRHPDHQTEIASGVWHYLLQPYHAALIVGGATVVVLIWIAARRRRETVRTRR